MKTSLSRYGLWFILAFALVVRLGWVLTHDVKDFDEYWEIVTHLLAGRGFALPEDGRIAATNIRVPLYPLLLAGITWLGGSWKVIGVLQAVVSAATCWWAYGIGKHLFGTRVGLLAALLIACDFPLIVMTGWLLTETLYVFLLGGIVYWVVTGAWQTWRGAILTGLFAGAACLTRSEAWLYLVLLFVAVLTRWIYGKAASGGVGQVLNQPHTSDAPRAVGQVENLPRINPLLACAIALLCVTPWLARNHFVLGQTAMSELLLLDFNLYRGLTDIRGDSKDYGFDFYLALRRNRSFFDGRRLEEPGVRADVRTRIVNEWRQAVSTQPLRVVQKRIYNLYVLWIYRGGFYVTESIGLGEAWRAGNLTELLRKAAFYFGFSLLPLALALIGTWHAGFRSAALWLWLYPVTITLLMIPLWADYRYCLPAHVMLAPLIARAFAALQVKNKT